METSRTDNIVSLAALREAHTKTLTAPREISQKTHDTPRDGGNDGAMTAVVIPYDGAMTGNDTLMTPLMTASESVARRLQSPAILQWLRDQYQPEEAATVLTGALLLAKQIQPGEELNATDLIKSTVTDGISYRLLTDKCKPLLVHAGIWNKNPIGKFQWVNWKKHREGANAVQMEQPQVQMAGVQGTNGANASTNASKLSALLHPQQFIDKLTLARAAKDPYCSIEYDLDGKPIITRHRKPFQGELTEQEKAAIRQSQEQAIYAKLIGSSGKISAEAAALAKQKQLEAIERKAAIDAQMDAIKMWGKVLGAVGVAAFVASTVGTGSPTEAQTTLPQGIHGTTQP